MYIDAHDPYAIKADGKEEEEGDELKNPCVKSQ